MFRRRNNAVEDENDPWKAIEKPAKKRPAPKDEGNLGVRLRAEMLPASQASSRFKAYRPKVKPGRVLTLVLLLVIAGLAWFFGLGPGRPGLERKLVDLITLVRQATAPTATSTPTPILPTLSPTATATRRPTATWHPTWTPTPAGPSATPPVIFTETPVSSCRDFSTITLDDVGQELCVQGVVIRVVENVGNTLVVFSDEAGAFYLVTYDVDWPDGTEGTCYQITGEVDRLLSSPVIVFGYNNLPVECP